MMGAERRRRRGDCRRRESMNNIEYYSTDMRWGARSNGDAFYDQLDAGREALATRGALSRVSGMIETAGNLAHDYRDHAANELPPLRCAATRRQPAAWAQGALPTQNRPVQVPASAGRSILFSQDGGLRRRRARLQSLGKLRR